MKFSIQVKNPGKVKKDILIAIQKHLRLKLLHSGSYINQINKWGEVILYEELMKSPTTQSIINGNLKEEFGIIDTSVISRILADISSRSFFSVKGPKIASDRILLEMKYEAVPIDLSEYDSIGRQITEKGQELPWFQWLTSLGDAVIVKDYKVSAGFPRYSRTGDKIMVKGSGWRVPPEHAGNQSDNFITKAADEALNQIGKLFVHEIRRALG